MKNDGAKDDAVRNNAAPDNAAPDNAAKDGFLKDVTVKDEVWMRDEVESPCVKLCVIHPEERLCVGCFRTIEEISQWSRLTPAARSAIIADLPTREPKLAKRRGGRMGRLDR